MVSVSEELSLRLHRVVLDARDLVTVHDVHQTLWRAFPGQPNGTPAPFLYRADRPSERAETIVALVQAVVEPSWGDVLLKEPAQSVSQRYDLSVGRRFRFYLRANPTVTRKDRGEPRFEGLTGEAFRAVPGRRVAILGEEERVAWLMRKGAFHGFEIVSREVRVGEGVERLPALRTTNVHTSFWSRAGQAAVRHDGLDFEGVLEVRDVARFREAASEGIGRGRAFGYGMLSLKPV